RDRGHRSRSPRPALTAKQHLPRLPNWWPTSSTKKICDSATPRLPRHGLALVVEVPQAGLTVPRRQRIGDAGNAFLDAEACRRSAHLGPNPTWIHQREAPSIAGTASRVGSHQGVESRLAGAVDFPAALFIQADAAKA